MSVEYSRDGEILVCAFSHRMDAARVNEVAAEVTEKTSGHAGPIAFDLAAVDYVASAFLRLCITTAKSAGTENFAVANVSPEVKRVFKITGLDFRGL